MLTEAAERYIALHRATGFKFKFQACVLRHFVRYASARGEDWVRSGTALTWASEAPSPGSKRDRLRVVRRFARAAALEEHRHEIPPEVEFGPRTPRRRPHIFTPEEIRRLLQAAASLGPSGSLRPRTYLTLLALMSCTGLRISEALALQLGDITAAGLVIRETKFRKSRLVPIDDSVRRGLDAYLAKRAKATGVAETVFVSSRGTPLPYPTAVSTFLALARSAGVRAGPGRPGPRLHDLRHTFAVRALEQCPRGRAAVQRHMLALSTYLGHAHLADTYWYLHATPRLLHSIAEAGEALATGGAR